MKNFLSLVKFSHTIFAMPFALTGFFIAVAEGSGRVDWALLGKVVLCMVFARTAAMAFNRWLDRDLDAANPRTATREIPAGVISSGAAMALVVVSSLFFVATTWFINPLCFWLSPVALAVVLGYSFTKRFTWLCHFVLGLGLSLAPVGAYLAVTGAFAWPPVLYGLAVLFWVSGFDVIYALQDDDFDKSQNLHSVPVWLGRARALRLSQFLHLGTAFFMLLAAWFLQNRLPSVGWLLWVATSVFLLLLASQHRLVKPQDLSRVNLAFFTTNGIASLIFGVLAVADLMF